MAVETRTPRLRGRRQPIAFTLPPELVEQIDAIATAEHRSRTMMIEIVIREWLEARGQDSGEREVKAPSAPKRRKVA
jgi:hypothetical protein